MTFDEDSVDPGVHAMIPRGWAYRCGLWRSWMMLASKKHVISESITRALEVELLQIKVKISPNSNVQWYSQHVWGTPLAHMMTTHHAFLPQRFRWAGDLCQLFQAGAAWDPESAEEVSLSGLRGNNILRQFFGIFCFEMVGHLFQNLWNLLQQIQDHLCVWLYLFVVVF